MHLLETFMAQTELVFGLFTSVFLGLLSTDVVLLFNIPVTIEKPFKDFTDLATKIIEDEVRLAPSNEIYPSLYSDPIWLKRDYESLYEGLKRTFKRKPILSVGKSSSDIVELIEGFPQQTIVVVVSESIVNDLKNKFCGLDFMPEGLKNTDYQGNGMQMT